MHFFCLFSTVLVCAVACENVIVYVSQKRQTRLLMVAGALKGGFGGAKSKGGGEKKTGWGSAKIANLGALEGKYKGGGDGDINNSEAAGAETDAVEDVDDEVEIIVKTKSHQIKSLLPPPKKLNLDYATRIISLYGDAASLVIFPIVFGAVLWFVVTVPEGDQFKCPY
jgi:hypothetical protein